MFHTIPCGVVEPKKRNGCNEDKLVKFVSHARIVDLADLPGDVSQEYTKTGDCKKGLPRYDENADSTPSDIGRTSDVIVCNIESDSQDYKINSQHIQ